MKQAKTASQRRELRRLAGLAGIASVGVLLGAFAWPRLPAVAQMNAVAQNTLIATAAGKVSTDRLVFVGIDSASLTLDALWPEDIAASPALTAMQKSRWPWPRSVFAEAVEKIIRAGASVVVLDILFSAPTDQDSVLRAVLDRYPNQVVLGSDYYFEQSDQGTLEPGMAMPSAGLIPSPSTDPRVGYVNFWPDHGYIRAAVWRTPLWARSGMPPVEGARVYASLGAATLTAIGEGWRIPAGWDPVPFLFPDPAAIRTVPFYTLFLEADWQKALGSGAVFRDKIVIIGPSATLLQDLQRTPMSDSMPGPLVHASALAAALSNGFYRLATPLENIGLIAVSALLAVGVTARVRRPTWALLIVFLSVVALVVAVAGAFYYGAVLFVVVTPILTGFSVGVAGLVWNFAIMRQEGVRLRSMLDRYVSRNVVREVLDNRDDFLTALGGTRKQMTVLFSDVRGFTAFSEEADASDVVTQLNEYFAVMVDVVFRHGGTVDKFMGDGLMAVWGNVMSEGPDLDAQRAVRAAVEMQERVAELNAGWLPRGLPPFSVGIGLHHGDAIFGNIGSEQKMEPTVIGDAVNLASRIEGLTKRYQTAICMSGAVAERVRGVVPVRSVDLVKVVGKSRAVEIFTIPAATTGADGSDWLAAYEEAVAHYRSGQFAAAEVGFRQVAIEVRGDPLIDLYLDRLKSLRDNPPGHDWSPEVRLDKK